MDRSYRRGYARRHVSARRNRNVVSDDKKTRLRTIKLAACGIIFALAALLKLLLPGVASDIGTAITTAVNYRAALTALGEGISGDKKFTTAIGEAITYAFRGWDAESTAPDSIDAVSIPDEDAVEVFGEDGPDIPAQDNDSSELPPDAIPDDTENAAQEAPGDIAETEEPGELANAIISAFLQTQEGYSDYSIPAGTTYDMPIIGAAHTAPIIGNITSRFGYRTHPVDGGVKFHYGIDIAANKGEPVLSFSDGEIVAVGESTTLGKYIIVTHGDFETLYAHCDEIHVSSGQAVTMGQIIANAGSTGNATSDCLHFELKIDGVFVNPGYYILNEHSV